MSRRAVEGQCADELVQKRKKTLDEEDVDVENFSGESEDEVDLTSEASLGEWEEPRKKLEPRTFLAHPYKPYDAWAVEYFNGRNVSKEARNLVESGINGFYKKEKGGGFPLNKFLEWLHKETNELVKGFVGGGADRGARRRRQEEIGSVVIFGTLSFDQLLDKEYEAKYKDDMVEAMKLVWGDIPASVPIISCFGSGVIANVSKKTIGPKGQRGIVQCGLELECDKLPFLSGMVIPKVDGLGIKNFVVTAQRCDTLKGNISLNKCKQVLGITDDKMEKNLKGIVFFHGCIDKYTENYNDSPAVKVLHRYLKENPHVAMAGGIHPTLLSNGTADEDVIACGFLIFGENNRVRVSCAALTEPEISIGKFDKLRRTLLVPENDENKEVSSFALMFGCNERGMRIHGKAHVESQYFHKIFPGTPLVGGFDLGEFYREILVHHPKLETLPRPAQIHFIHVSVFLLVSYRHPKA